MERSRRLAGGILAAALVAAAGAGGCAEAEVERMSSSEKPREAASQPAGPAGREVATFGAGCFWGVEVAFRCLQGVTETTVGYSGGTFKNPSYKDVCSGRTGHAEVVRVVYNPAKVSYERLLEVFWACHDPTTPNRQGPDVGSQYRSVIFHHNAAQAAAAKASKERLDRSGRFGRPIVTQIAPAGPFYRAEEYHQQYLEKRGRASCKTPP